MKADDEMMSSWVNYLALLKSTKSNPSNGGKNQIANLLSLKKRLMVELNHWKTSLTNSERRALRLYGSSERLALLLVLRLLGL